MNFILKIIDIIFPHKCHGCGKIVSDGGGLCSICWSSVHFISGKTCNKCGYPVEFDFQDESQINCARCIKDKPIFDKSQSVCSYTNYTVKNMIRRLKYHDDLIVGKFLSKMILSKYKPMNGDLLCPVPMHKESIMQKGYNQSAIVAKAIFIETIKAGYKINYYPNLLLKIRKTKRQNQLKRQDRLTNVVNSIIVNEAMKFHISKCSRVILIDDVITTGATLNECAKQIRKSFKDKRIECLTFAITTIT